MDEFVRKVRSTCERYDLLAPGDKVIVAVSGGADSTAMLLALKELAPEYDLQLYVAHLNHLMRGEQAEADANWVQELDVYKRQVEVWQGLGGKVEIVVREMCIRDRPKR